MPVDLSKKSVSMNLKFEGKTRCSFIPLIMASVDNGNKSSALQSFLASKFIETGIMLMGDSAREEILQLTEKYLQTGKSSLASAWIYKK